jgi:hypothetical protein
MATGTVILPIPASGVDTTNPPGMLYENNGWVYLFNDTTDEICYWHFQMPTDYASAPVLKIKYKMDTATTLEVIVACSVKATADGEDPASSGYDTVNTSAATTVPGTAELLDTISLTLTNADGIAAGELCSLEFSRDANNAGDDATGDMKLVAASFEYTTS